MLEPPHLSTERLVACLEWEYGLTVTSITFLPWGADVDTAVYRIETGDDAQLFLKLRRSFEPASVIVPHLLAGQGAQNIIAPLTTRAGELFVEFEGFTVLLAPFVEGVSGWDTHLTPEQWRALGLGLKALHTIEVPESLRAIVPRESFDATARLFVQQLLEESVACRGGDVIAAELVRIVQEKRDVIALLLWQAQELSARLLLQPPAYCLCHGDIHAGNVLLCEGKLLIVDWDTLILAPPERDLMFIGGGVGGCWNQPQEVQWFEEGYGAYESNPIVLAYYRCERIIQDIAEFAQALLVDEHSEAERREMLKQFASQFDKGNVVEITLNNHRGREH